MSKMTPAAPAAPIVSREYFRMSGLLLPTAMGLAFGVAEAEG
jgi:hypothetical protein